jgi:hypothetical protein
MIKKQFNLSFSNSKREPDCFPNSEICYIGSKSNRKMNSPFLPPSSLPMQQQRQPFVAAVAAKDIYFPEARFVMQEFYCTESPISISQHRCGMSSHSLHMEVERHSFFLPPFERDGAKTLEHYLPY